MEINLQVIDGCGTFRPQNTREPTMVLKYEGGVGKKISSDIIFKQLENFPCI